MQKEKNVAEGLSSKEFSIHRTFNAPREVLFNAWTKVEHLSQWWGPKDIEIVNATLDLRPGGKFHYGIKQGENISWGCMLFREIVAPERIVFVNSFSNKNAEIVPPPFSDPWPSEMLHVVTFEEQGGKTLLSLRSRAINATEEECRTFEEGFASMNEGYGGTFEKLENYLRTLIK